MDIDIYTKTPQFQRNQAMYVLHKVDKKPLQEIAVIFQLALVEVETIIAYHQQYMMALEAV